MKNMIIYKSIINSIVLLTTTEIYEYKPQVLRDIIEKEVGKIGELMGTMDPDVQIIDCKSNTSQAILGVIYSLFNSEMSIEFSINVSISLMKTVFDFNDYSREQVLKQIEEFVNFQSSTIRQE